MSGETSSIILGNRRPQKIFKSSIGVALSCLGSAVGTGNIWRYPRIVANNTGENGALAFILVWILFLFTWSIPLLLIEYGTGRFTKAAAILSFKKLVGKYTMWCGAFIGFVSTCIASYYAVICGWCLYYLFYFMVHPLPGTVEPSQDLFEHFAQHTRLPVLLQAIVILLGGLSVIAGVRSIEPVMLVMVPTLLLLMIASFVYSLTLSHAWVGIRHLFSMDWSVFAQPQMWIQAMTQNAWDTGAASGILLVYASYMEKHHGVVRYGTLIPAINNFMSLLMAITIFSTIFSVQISLHPDYTVNTVLETFKYNGPANTGLTFIWMPILFSTLRGGRVFAVIFFACLFIAGFSSFVSFIEASTRPLEDMKVPRKFGVPAMCLLIFLLGLGSSLSLDFLANQDYVWGNAILVSGALLVFMVIRYGTSKFRTLIVNEFGDGSDWKLPVIWEWVVKIIIPLELILLLVWWIVNSVLDKTRLWYIITQESLSSALLQWSVALILVIAVNLLYVRYAPIFLARAYHIFSDEDDGDLVSTIDRTEQQIPELPEVNSDVELAQFGIPESYSKFGIPESYSSNRSTVLPAELSTFS